MEDLVNKLTSDKDNLWLGFNTINHWVILDRELSPNKNGLASIFFTKCSDWTSYEEQRSKWEEPNYIYFLKFIQNLESEKKEKTLKELNLKKEEYLKSVRKVKNQIEVEKKFEKIKLIHNKYLKLKDLSSSSIAKTSQINRITVCWNWRVDLDNQKDYECTSCKWIVCPSCGACKKYNCNVVLDKI